MGSWLDQYKQKPLAVPSLSEGMQEVYNSMTKAGFSQDEILRAVKDYAAMQMHPQVVSTPSPPARKPPPPPLPIRDHGERLVPDAPQLFDHVRNELTPVGAICMRLQRAKGYSHLVGEPLPGVQHLSAHVVYAAVNHSTFEPVAIEKAYVFVVNRKGEALTFEDPTPSLFPSDTLILQLQMVMDGSKEP